jgi:hypothetical protein
MAHRGAAPEPRYHATAAATGRFAGTRLGVYYSPQQGFYRKAEGGARPRHRRPQAHGPSDHGRYAVPGIRPGDAVTCAD